MQKVVEELAEEVAVVSLVGGRSASSSRGVVVGHDGVAVSVLWLSFAFFTCLSDRHSILIMMHFIS